MRALLILISLLLVGCSYNPNHYYYDCESDRYTNTFYRHNKTLIDGQENEYEFLGETAQIMKFKRKDYLDWSYRLRVNKVNNSIEVTIINDKGARFRVDNYSCTVTKTLTPL